MIKYNPVFHDKSLKLLLPKHNLSNPKIDAKLRAFGFILPEFPTDRKVVGYIIHPQNMDTPCSLIVIDCNNPSVTPALAYKEGVDMYNKLDFDELEFDFFERRYGRG